MSEKLLFQQIENKIFSNHYLEYILPTYPLIAGEWDNDDSIRKVYDQIMKLYKEQKEILPPKNEPQLEESFIRPILKILGHHFIVQENITGHYQTPDYLFFTDENAKNEAYKNADKYETAILVGDAKRWKVSLDKKPGKGGTWDMQIPSFQIYMYMVSTDKEWGIVSNGHTWRLYNKETKSNRFYSVPLAEILDEDNFSRFKYFYFFFRREAFIIDDGKCFLDRVKVGSKGYAKQLGDELQENIYQCLKILAQGFLDYEKNALNSDPETIKKIHDNCLILLYRMIFVLYAESEKHQLLPIFNVYYRNSYSFHKIKSDIFKVFKGGREDIEFLPHNSTLWNRINALFDIINKGSEIKIVSSDAFKIPSYNGRLFNPDKHPFLATKQIPDNYLAKAIKLLTVADVKDKGKDIEGFIDYTSFETRHMGSIYEGLLEYKLNVAPENMVATKEKGKLIWKKESEIQNKKIFDKVESGRLYLVTDKGERKATGSYYTPDYIVKYIVQNTLGPIVDEIIDRAFKSGTNPVDDILKLTVLDPAMGSGHFLVEATDFLAEKIIRTNKDMETEEGQDINWAKREVVKRCIYGVDLNPLATELAKLSLWLETVAVNKPLAFLDHHLKCGNSLIGADLKEIGELPGTKKKKEKAGTHKSLWDFEPETIDYLLVNYNKLVALSDDNLSDVKKKEELFQESAMSKEKRRFVEISNIWTSTYFGDEVTLEQYQTLWANINASEEKWDELRKEEWFRKGQEIAQDKNFFHWELEFPEVFFEEGKEKRNPGFDGVIGNPPYDVLAEKELGFPIDHEKKFFKSINEYVPSLGHKLNLYRLFTVKALNLTKRNLKFGFIIPMTILGDFQATKTRKWLLDNFQIEIINAFPQKDDPYKRVFFEAKLPTSIIIITNKKPSGKGLIITHPGKLFEEVSKQYKVDQIKIQHLDESTFSIPLLSEREWKICERIFLSEFVKKLGNDYPSYQGEINETSMKQYLTKEPIGPEILRGGVVQRYELLEVPKQGEKWHLNLDKYENEVSDASKKAHVDSWRIGYQRNSALDNYRRVISTIIPPRNHFFDSISYLLPKEEDRYFILSILNSKIMEFRFRLTSTNNHVNGYEIETLPIRRINFTTPEPERKGKLEKLKKLYHEEVDQ